MTVILADDNFKCIFFMNEKDRIPIRGGGLIYLNYDYVLWYIYLKYDIFQLRF